MKRLVFFDAISVMAALALLFTVGFHIGKDDEPYRKIQFEIVIIPEKISGAPLEDKVTMIDGKYECRIKSYGYDRIVISCDGYFSEAGYLLSGAKYVSVNQPISASQSGGYFEGRIYDVYRTT